MRSSSSLHVFISLCVKRIAFPYERLSTSTSGWLCAHYTVVWSRIDRMMKRRRVDQKTSLSLCASNELTHAGRKFAALNDKVDEEI
jgi:hypothetical protein